jgi:hypothetical protein
MVDTISDENVPPADDRHDFMSDDERGPLVDTDAKQAGCAATTWPRSPSRLRALMC